MPAPAERAARGPLKTFIVPTFISSTQPVEVEMKATLYSLVPPAGPGAARAASRTNCGSFSRTRTDADLTQPIVVVDGGQPERRRVPSL